MAARMLLPLALLATHSDALRDHVARRAHWNLPSGPSSPRLAGTPGVPNCTLNWFTQNVDHFNYSNPGTYQQRYYTYSDVWDPVNGVIFLYTGNEGDVTLYVNHAGLMWEQAAAFKALLVFAEHRYYGASQPGDGMAYLSHEQALADYATLLASLQANLTVSQPVIAFGGSYGGMLSAWMRMSYPGVILGAISSSAPVRGYQGQTPLYNNESYWAVVTRDATAAAGAAPACAANVRAAWDAMFTAGSSAAGRANLTTTFQMCAPLTSPADVSLLALFHLNAWDTMAMGNYPYPSNYLTGGGPYLPAFPVRAACDYLQDATLPSDPWALLSAFNAAGNVFNNATQVFAARARCECVRHGARACVQNVPCYSLPTDPWFDGIWDYQFCTETMCEETYWTRDGVNDMFYPWSIDNTGIDAHCQAAFGLSPRYTWIANKYGSIPGSGISNILFTNGGYDPWSSAGVKANYSSGVTSILIPEGAHHLDLFFTNPADPPSVTGARQTAVALIRSWVAGWYAAANETQVVA